MPDTKLATMPKNVMINYRGREVLDKVERAAADGIDEIMAKCVVSAKTDVPVATAAYQGSIKIVQPAGRE